MCGIAGIYFFDSQRAVLPEDLLAMNNQMVHRGPDDAGHAIFGHFGMAMRRLSIIDLAGGHQPLSNEDGTVWAVLNGEIYNFPELRRNLLARGHFFKTHSDTEVLVHAYEEYGQDFVRSLNGMFAFALWDRRQQKLILGRDRLGVKPLYYYQDEHMLAFGSEIKALAALPQIPREVNPEALDEFLSLEYTLAPRTMWKGVWKLEPGHLLVIQNRQVKHPCYWTGLVAPRHISEEEACELLRQELGAAVRRRLISDVPLGAFLSGGIDSSIVVGLMSQEQSRPVKTFSLGFEDASYNELDYARLVARKFSTDHQEFIVKPDPPTLLENFIASLDEPLADTSVFPVFLISQLARQKVTVALAGDGGDELFGGYDAYAADRWARLYQRLPGRLRTLLKTQIEHFHPTEQKKGLINKLLRFQEGLGFPAEIEHYRWLAFLSEKQRQELYAPAFWRSLPPGNAFERLRAHFARALFQDRLNRQIYTDLKVYLPEDILAKVDITSMANSLEVRGPFLDYRVVELALSLPGSFKIKGARRKYILKKAFQHLLPPAILNRKKEGFSIPLKNWLKEEWRDVLGDTLTKESLARSGYFQWNAVERMIREHQTGTHNHAHRLWALMVFCLWHDKFVQKKRSRNLELCPTSV